MLKENEVVMLFLGICVLVLIFINKEQARKIQGWRIIFSSYCLLLSGWLFTVLEEIILPDMINFLEHACYLISALLLSIWAWKITGASNKEEKI
jgi:hypothetical protein